MSNDFGALYGVHVTPFTTDYIVIARIAGYNEIFTFTDFSIACEYAKRLNGFVFSINYDSKNNSYILDKILYKKERGKKNEKV